MRLKRVAARLEQNELFPGEFDKKPLHNIGPYCLGSFV